MNTKSITETRKDDRSRRAAILLSSLPQSQQTALLKQLPIEAAQRLSESITALGEISASEKRQALNEFRNECGENAFEELMSSSEKVRVDPPHYDGTKTVDPSRLGTTDSSALFLETQTGFDFGVQGGFEFLQSVPVKLVAKALELEDPQTVAIVLSHLPSDLAADLLTNFDLDWRMAILRRMVNSIPRNPGNEKEIRIRLQQRLDLTPPMDGTKGGLYSIIQLLGKMERTARQTLIDRLTVNDLSLAKRLSQQCIDFDDFAKLKDEEVKQLLGNIDTSLLAPAFSRCKHLTRHKLMKNLADDAREIVKKEINDFLPHTKHEVESAQQSILQKIFKLKNEGTLFQDASKATDSISSKAA